MATFTDARANHGLSASGTPTSTNITGSVSVGVNNTQTRLTESDVAYSLRGIFAGSGDVLNLVLTSGSTAGSTTWVAGTAQVETATITAASGCTSNGNMVMVLTAAGMAGSPLNVTVALTTAAHTTAALIAAAGTTALNATTVVASMFTATTATTGIVLTRNPTTTVNGISIYPANDATLNLAIPAGLGVSAAASSADTTAGVATDGVYIYDGDAKDFEGVALSTIAEVQGLLIQQTTGTSTVTGAADVYDLVAGESVQRIGASGIGSDTTLAVTAGAAADVTITVVGATV